MVEMYKYLRGYLHDSLDWKRNTGAIYKKEESGLVILESAAMFLPE